MKPYYEDERVTLYHGDCMEILPALDIKADVLLTDPPYFKVKEDEWDNQWAKAHEFLSWLGGFLEAAKPLLQPHASVWVFASPAMTSSVERLVGERFRVLNSIRWVKEQGWHQKAEVEALRSYLTPWEGVIFAEQVDSDKQAQEESGWADACRALHQEVFSPLGQYLRGEWERAGWEAGRLGVSLGYDSALPTRWAEGGSLPSEAGYAKLRALLGDGFLTRDLSELREQYQVLKVIYERRRDDGLLSLQERFNDLRRPFNISARANSTDVWHFPTVAPYPGKHPCEKPSSMLRHMIETSSKPGQIILDPFAGSGSTLEAAKHAGRRAIGIEREADYCRAISYRLAQDVLDFGGAA